MRRIFPALLVLVVAAMGLRRAEQVGRLLPVVGLWSEQRGAEPSLLTDGATWTGSTTRDALATVSKTLFASTSDDFLTNGSSAGAFPLAVDRQTSSFSEGTLRVQFKLISGPTDQSAGIVIGLAPTGAYQFVRYNTKDGNIALWGFAKGERQVVAKGEGLEQLPLGAWHELVVRVQGQQLRASITGHPTLDFATTLAAPVSGRVGLWAKRDVVTAFRGFAVETASHN